LSADNQTDKKPVAVLGKRIEKPTPDRLFFLLACFMQTVNAY